MQLRTHSRRNKLASPLENYMAKPLRNGEDRKGIKTPKGLRLRSRRSKGFIPKLSDSKLHQSS